jgi:hypothetical protein
MKTENPDESWASAWPDALAFAIGLAVARWAGWNAGDLVWSLWLSSLVVGYSVIVWTIGQPAFELGRAALRAGKVEGMPAPTWPVWAILFVGTLLVLGFFSVHFGGFHYIHSQLLASFFPIDIGSTRHLDWAGTSIYGEVVRRYWPFLPAALLAERATFMRKPLSLEGDASLTAVVSPVAGKSAGKSDKGRELFAAPYRNVARIHMLIFFFFFAHFAKLDNFAVYAVVYAVYFFPWRLLRRSTAEPVPV